MIISFSVYRATSEPGSFLYTSEPEHGSPLAKTPVSAWTDLRDPCKVEEVKQQLRHRSAAPTTISRKIFVDLGLCVGAETDSLERPSLLGKTKQLIRLRLNPKNHFISRVSSAPRRRRTECRGLALILFTYLFHQSPQTRRKGHGQRKRRKKRMKEEEE